MILAAFFKVAVDPSSFCRWCHLFLTSSSSSSSSFVDNCSRHQSSAARLVDVDIKVVIFYFRGGDIYSPSFFLFVREREKEERVKMSGKNEMRKRVLYAHGVVFFTRVGTFFFFFFLL
tara:strand:+ start:897 stop:1250 length:354 start_codon:yes stop_codon:yes gene_type:complete